MIAAVKQQAKSDISIHSLIRGRTHFVNKNRQTLWHFNPLPHTRENGIQGYTRRVHDISIHSLIRGRTRCFPLRVGLQRHFNPLPHTRENSDKMTNTSLFFISIHSLIRGRTASELTGLTLTLFQSTPSYEGEPVHGQCRNCGGNFNPLPHTRENYSDKVSPHFLAISIHSLIRGRTIAAFSSGVKDMLFQSTPSYEGERFMTGRKDIVTIFQSTPSYEGEPSKGR